MVYQCKQLLSVPKCTLRVSACIGEKVCVWTHILLPVCVGERVRLYKCELFHVHVCPLECVCVHVRAWVAERCAYSCVHTLPLLLPHLRSFLHRL